jgi:NAD/NADP transhydrogenase alpha subunit
MNETGPITIGGPGETGPRALASAHRLGARTTGYDVRPETAEQVRMLGDCDRPRMRAKLSDEIVSGACVGRGRAAVVEGVAA